MPGLLSVASVSGGIVPDGSFIGLLLVTVIGDGQMEPPYAKVYLIVPDAMGEGYRQATRSL